MDHQGKTNGKKSKSTTEDGNGREVAIGSEGKGKGKGKGKSEEEVEEKVEKEEEEEGALFICDNELDNVPVRTCFEGDGGEEVVFSISQNRINGKEEGQDAMGALLRGQWECCVLCDGHDMDGAVVARRVCSSLATNLLDNLQGMDITSTAAERAIILAFQKTERDVLWSNEGISANSFVKVVKGDFTDNVGYVSEVHEEDGTFSVIIIDADSYHKPRLRKDELECAKYTGGCTCVAFMRDGKRNIVRFAVMGDTRVLVVKAPRSGLAYDPIFEEVDARNGCYLSYPHDVFNTAELNRIMTDYEEDDYVIDGPYLINPFTGCEIQPTRGFGDFDMYGSGYINIPDVSRAFTMERGSLVMVASDGVFDDQVWDFDELVEFIQESMISNDIEKLCEDVHTETIAKSLEGGYVDDISIFTCSIGLVNDSQQHSNSPRNSKTNKGSQAATAVPNASANANVGNNDNKNNLKLDTTAPEAPEIPKPKQKQNGSVATPSPKPVVPQASKPKKEFSPRQVSLSGHGGNLQAAKRSSTAGSLAQAAMSSAASRLRSATSSAAAATSTAAYRKKKAANERQGVSRSRAATADFVNPQQPRYLRERRSEYNLGGQGKSTTATVRRTRGPSYTLPKGVDDEMAQRLSRSSGLSARSFISSPTGGAGGSVTGTGVGVNKVGSSSEQSGGSTSKQHGSSLEPIAEKPAGKKGTDSKQAGKSGKRASSSTNPQQQQQGQGQGQGQGHTQAQASSGSGAGTGSGAETTGEMQEQAINAVLVRIANRFGHDVDGVERLLSDFDVV